MKIKLKSTNCLSIILVSSLNLLVVVSSSLVNFMLQYLMVQFFIETFMIVNESFWYLCKMKLFCVTYLIVVFYQRCRLRSFVSQRNTSYLVCCVAVREQETSGESSWAATRAEATPLGNLFWPAATLQPLSLSQTAPLVSTAAHFIIVIISQIHPGNAFCSVTVNKYCF